MAPASGAPAASEAAALASVVPSMTTESLASSPGAHTAAPLPAVAAAAAAAAIPEPTSMRWGATAASTGADGGLASSSVPGRTLPAAAAGPPKESLQTLSEGEPSELQPPRAATKPVVGDDDDEDDDSEVEVVMAPPDEADREPDPPIP